ncbi:MAG: hypothetical protein EA355_07950 [Rhodobacteraceae bacterium]|nr:MAG: hypothetical protein EA355_07950 [Paracoccaceae bacterium]
MELIVVACLISAPERCAEHRLLLDIHGLDPAQCVYSSPIRVAQWSIQHPAWRVTGWRCVLPAEDRLT